MNPIATTTAYRKMYKIVWILLGVFSLFAVTFPIAMWRVSQKDKFHGSHVKSFPLEGRLQQTADNHP